MEIDDGKEVSHEVSTSEGERCRKVEILLISRLQNVQKGKIFMIECSKLKI